MTAAVAGAGARRRRRRALAIRFGLFAAMAVGAGLTGLWWSHARHDGLEVDAGMTVRLEARPRGGIEVTEVLTFDRERLGESRLRRSIDPSAHDPVVLEEVEAEHHDAVLVVPRPDDGLTLDIEAEAGSPVTLVYAVEGTEDELDLGTVDADLDQIDVVSTDGERLVLDDREANEAIVVPLGPAAEAEDGPDDTPPWNAIGIAVGVLAALAWLVTLRRSRPDVGAGTGAQDGLPSGHSPAEVGWLLRHGRVTLADLAATVVDLTARGFILPYRREDALVLGQGRPAVDLAPHEVLALDWLFASMAREADLDAKRSAITETPSLWSDLWDRFVAEVERRGRDDDLVEREVASPTVLVVAGCGLAVLIAGVVGMARGYPGWLACVLAGSLVVAGATAFARRSPRGEALAAQWEAFGRDLHTREDITPHALAYAVTLDEGDAARHRVDDAGGSWPAQLVHEEVERRVTGWREAYLAATSVRGEPSARLRAFLSLRALRRRASRTATPTLPAPPSPRSGT